MENSPHFFKIILGDSISKGRLGIPRKFARKYGNDLSTPIILQVPSGDTWQVELLKSDGEIWLENGWQEFAEYHSLDHGYFLVFRYYEHCHFHVLIFDKSASEIEYPCKNLCIVDQNHDGQFQQPDQLKEIEDGISVESLDDLSPHRNGREITSLPSPPCKKLKTSTTDKEINNLALQALPEQVSNHSTPAGCGMIGTSHCSDEEFGGNFKQLTWKENVRGQATSPSCSSTAQALEAANKFISNYPLFKSVVHVDCIGRFIVTISARFSKMHFEFQSRIFTLRFADGFWPVKVINYGNLAKFSAGWAAFVKANYLKAGDVCIFELIESNVMNVSVFKCVHGC